MTGGQTLDVAALAPADRVALFEYLQRVGDDRLVLGHRLSEWCGHAPILEEDIALGNIALDLLGQARLLLARAARIVLANALALLGISAPDRM